MNALLTNISTVEKDISKKVLSGIKISTSDAEYLYNSSSLSFCAYLASLSKDEKFGRKVY